MACIQTRHAWRPVGKTGRLNFTSKPKRRRDLEEFEIPCGYCILCRQRQTQQQQTRLLHECRSWDTSSFITLTYNDQSLPANNSLDYTDLQKFWKRLRKAGEIIAYYAIGEYGDKTTRPHYHAIVYGQAWADEHRVFIKPPPDALWTNAQLEQAWGLGHVAVAPITPATAAYVASYAMKKLHSQRQYVTVDETTGELIRLEQPRAFMSKNLAKKWWNQYHQYTIDHDRVALGGQYRGTPKAYDRWLEQIQPTIMKEIKQKRKENALKETYDQIHARAHNAHARARKNNKNL